MKKILFTNLEMYNFAGSEIATMSLSSYFLSKGWEVSVFTLAFGEPLQSKLDKRIKIYTIENKEELSDYYDLIWAHHYPLLDYVLFHLRIKAKHIYAEALSCLTVIETLTIYYKYLSMIGVVSEKAKIGLFEKGFDTSGAYILPNYASQEFFDKKHNIKSKIEKIAIVSNHVSPELDALPKYCKNKGVDVDIYGINHKYVLIDSDVLNDYDVVVSIGKTVFYSLAIGIPSYTYDLVGVSQGYINLENYEKNLDANFAYTKTFDRKTTEEIFNDIVDNYGSIASQCEELKKLSYDKFLFKNLMNNLFDKIMSSSPVNFEKLYAEFGTLTQPSRLYVEDRTNYCNLVKAQQEIIKNQQEIIEINNKALVDKDSEITLIKNSTCWKLTSPLRRILSIIKK